MKVSEFACALNGEILTGDIGAEREISGVYVCDLLSWVMSHAGKGNIWITVLTHLNTVAVALLTEVSCMIVPESIKVEEATVKKAIQEGVVIISCTQSAYEICCKAERLMKIGECRV